MTEEAPTPSDLRQALERRLETLPKVTLDRWKDTDLVCLFFDGKQFAHFHGETILDLRLTPKIIRDAQLSRAVSARIHPNRSQNSRWIGIEFKSDADIDKLIDLVRKACDEVA